MRYGLSMKFTVLLWLILSLFISAYAGISQEIGNAQTQDTSTSKIYLGLNTGFSAKNIGYSSFLPKLGGNILYNWDNNFVTLSYNKLFEFTIPFAGSNLGKSNFQRLELLYGYTMVISKKHKLFKHISFSASIGVSYNYIKYYKDEYSSMVNHLSVNQSAGVPIGIAITNNIGKVVYFGWELKYHIIQKIAPYGEVAGFIMVNVY